MATTNPTQVDLKAAATFIREEDLDDLEALLRDLQDRVDKAREDGRIYLMSQYVRLVAMVSPEIDRIQRRFKRESLAAMRREHKRLKLEVKAAAESNGA
jgi:hypothetical protein